MKEKGLSDGPHYLETPMTLRKPTRLFWNCFQRTRAFQDGSIWLKKEFNSKAYLPESAGWGMENGLVQAWPSTN